jgi:hypothetical protein
MRFGWKAKDTFNRTLWLAYTVSVVFMVAYIVLYLFEPFSEVLNTFFSNFFLQVASFVAALIAFLIWRHYDKNDTPRRVWGPFTIGLFLWFIAEMTWGYINITQTEVPVGPADVFWIIAYLFFGWALISQYVILLRPSFNKLLARIVMAVLFLVTFTLLTYLAIIKLSGSSNYMDALINSFYPVADMLLAIVAIRLAHNFSGGALARPWLGLIVFAFSDLFYAWLEISGLYTWSATQCNLLTTISDVLYLTAYIVMGISLLYQWLFLKYGMRPR